MARVTVEDCLEKIPNRFDMILTASKRARKLLASGEEPMVEWDNDKVTVVHRQVDRRERLQGATFDGVVDR